MKYFWIVWLLCYGMLAQAQQPTPEQLREATQNYLQAAQAGDPSAQHLVSQAYWNGWGVTKHDAIALRWLEKSVAQDFPPAVFDMGVRKLNGLGLDKNIDEGISTLDRAATMGYTPAMVVLGAYYLNLTFDHQVVDAQKGEKYLSKAASMGDPDAMQQLGVMYMYGLEPEASFDADIKRDEAVAWLTKSANLFNVNAMLTLGLFYSDPANQTLNSEKAYFWFYLVNQLTGQTPEGMAEAELQLGSATRSKVKSDVQVWIQARKDQFQPIQ